mmetsp:Transcript_44181/g.92276  ORF Transcript_44181/g.92276 Transcript_44181/m.92276 type:complete len:240 (-) Transcript_44181:136-855(-)
MLGLRTRGLLWGSACACKRSPPSAPLVGCVNFASRLAAITSPRHLERRAEPNDNARRLARRRGIEEEHVVDGRLLAADELDDLRSDQPAENGADGGHLCMRRAEDGRHEIGGERVAQKVLAQPGGVQTLSAQRLDLGGVSSSRCLSEQLQRAEDPGHPIGHRLPFDRKGLLNRRKGDQIFRDRCLLVGSVSVGGHLGRGRVRVAAEVQRAEAKQPQRASSEHLGRLLRRARRQRHVRAV